MVVGPVVVQKTMINGSVAGFSNYIIFVVFPVKIWMRRVGQREILRVDSDKNFGVHHTEKYNVAFYKIVMCLFQRSHALQTAFTIQVCSELSHFPTSTGPDGPLSQCHNGKSRLQKPHILEKSGPVSLALTSAHHWRKKWLTVNVEG